MERPIATEQRQVVMGHPPGRLLDTEQVAEPAPRKELRIESNIETNSGIGRNSPDLGELAASARFVRLGAWLATSLEPVGTNIATKISMTDRVSFRILGLVEDRLQPAQNGQMLPNRPHVVQPASIGRHHPKYRLHWPELGRTQAQVLETNPYSFNPSQPTLSCARPSVELIMSSNLVHASSKLAGRAQRLPNSLATPICFLMSARANPIPKTNRSKQHQREQ